MNPPDSIKSIKPFLIRSQQFAEAEPLMSYFLRMHALEIILPQLKQLNDPEAKKFAVTLMTQLETDKKSFPFSLSEVDGLQYCCEIAEEIFSKVLEQDNAGNSTKASASTFDVVRVIYDCCAQFGTLSEDLKKRRSYCLLRSTQIVKGQLTPTVNSPAHDDVDGQEKSIPCDTSSEESTIDPSQQSFDPEDIESLAIEPTIVESSSVEPIKPIEAPPVEVASPPVEVDYVSIQKAEKHIKWGLSALHVDDIPTTIQNLEAALKLLKGN
ncbi:hypothetical protein RCL1_008175 [Eukaryota sp. TZLM3-RCL]